MELKWLEAIFDERIAEDIKGSEDFIKALKWYKAFRNEIGGAGLKNRILEECIDIACGNTLSREELRADLRRFRERMYYEAYIRKTGGRAC